MQEDRAALWHALVDFLCALVDLGRAWGGVLVTVLLLAFEYLRLAVIVATSLAAAAAPWLAVGILCAVFPYLLLPIGALLLLCPPTRSR